MNAHAPVLDLISKMRCDGGSRVLIGCLQPVKWGLRIHVPSLTQLAPGHAQVRVTLPFHACDPHKEAGCFKLDDFLIPKVKADVELHAKRARPIDWKPDFDAAFIQYVDCFSPEYKKFLRVIEGKTIEEAQRIWGPIARC